MKDTTLIINLTLYQELWVIGGLIGISMISPPLLPWIVASGSIYLLISWFVKGRPNVRTPIDFGVLILIVMIPVTLWATAIPQITHLQVYRLISGLMLFYAVVNWTTSLLKIKVLVFGFVIASFGLGLIALFSVDWMTHKYLFIPESFYTRLPALVEDTIHPNVLAGNLLLFLPFTLGLIVFAKNEFNWFLQSILIIATISTGLFIVFSQSRMALVSMVAILMMMGVLRIKKSWIAVIPLSFLAGYYLYAKGFNTVLNSLGFFQPMGGLEGRIEVWSRAIFMIQDFSFTGVGFGSFQKVADLLYPFFLFSQGTVDHAHNLFLQIAVDVGIPGLIGWLSILITIIGISIWVFKTSNRGGNNFLAGVGAGLICSQLGLIIHGLIDSTTWGMVKPAPFVWGIWGLAIAVYTHMNQSIGDQVVNTKTNTL